MNNHFTITINDDHGVKQFYLHQVVKKAIWYVVLFLGFITLIAVGTILYLDHSVDQIEIKRESTQQAFDILKEKNTKLNQSMRETQMALLTKKKELNEVSDSLSEIETLIATVSHYITLIAMSAIGLMIHFGTIVKSAGTAFKVSSLLFALQLIFSAILIGML